MGERRARPRGHSRRRRDVREYAPGLQRTRGTPSLRGELIMRIKVIVEVETTASPREVADEVLEILANTDPSFDVLSVSPAPLE